MNFTIPQGLPAGYRFSSARQQHHHQCSLLIRNILMIVVDPVSICSTGRHSTRRVYLLVGFNIGLELHNKLVHLTVWDLSRRMTQYQKKIHLQF